MRREDHDPYAPPPRHKERSGAIVRFAIIAALLGAAAWGYMEYSQQPRTALVEPEEQRVADSGYQPAPITPAPTGTPAETPAPAQPTEPASAPAQSDPPA